MIERLQIAIHGAVQGVGFRPHVYRLARQLDLNGWVINDTNGVQIEVESDRGTLETFLTLLQNEKPPLAFISSREFSYHDPVGYKNFEIRHSKNSDQKTALILPDIATCETCLAEIFDPKDRRFHYAFTNCTNCGPRYSIIESLPYDRERTAMKIFPMCENCNHEYENPIDRRFHAEPNACEKCGPKLNAEIDTITDAIRNGKIIALKGLGGFQLIVDARNDQAVRRLRDRKHREEKPFAVMFPSIDQIEKNCDLNDMEIDLIDSLQKPIVLAKRKIGSEISKLVAPNNSDLGVMLPYTPLHHILTRQVDFPIVATSGNLSDEPMAIDNNSAIEKLSKIADLFLTHDRPIRRCVDDSVAKVIVGKTQMIRRARGYAPLPIRLAKPLDRKILAVGGHLKNTIAIAQGDQVFVSQHLGDLETLESYYHFVKMIEDLQKLYDFDPEVVACDLHPNYLSTKFAKQIGKPIITVQHHHAHIASCMAENQIDGEVLGVAWDGTGFGTDGTIWGGEFLICNNKNYNRVAYFLPFNLPSGEKAIREISRSAIGLRFAVDKNSIDFLHRQNIEKKINAPLTSSVGRLFDGVASLIGLRQKVSFEGQAAIELENAIQLGTTEIYPFELIGDRPMIIDWRPMICEILRDRNHISIGEISAKFHNTLVEIIFSIVKRIGIDRICLSGGTFQNRYLTEKVFDRLTKEKYKIYINQRVPTNDGGISLGQIFVADRIERG